ncbi:MAG: adenylate/guanylate cyclase domain-containing protein, partial [Candidatus Ozemobacteraceae bacterium]
MSPGVSIKRRLEPAIDASPETIRALLQEWVLEARRLSDTSNILYVSRALTFVRSDGLEIFVPDNPLYKVENHTLMKIERDLAAEKLFLLNVYSSRSQAEQTRERTRIDLMHSVLDSLIGQSWISGLFKQDATFSNVPFNSKTQMYSTITLRRPKTGEVVATVIFKYFAQGLSHSFLASMLADPGQFQGTLPGYKLEYAIFQQPENYSTDLSIGWYGRPRRLEQFYDAAEDCLKSSKNRRWNTLGKPGGGIFVSRLFTTQPHLGVGRATPIKKTGPSEHQALALLACYVLLMVLVIAGTLSRLLTAPIKIFTRTALAVGSGILEARLPVTSSDEFGRLAAAFNRMISGLEERRRMARFVSADVLEAVSADTHSGSASLEPGGEAAEVSVLFSHIRDFTTLSREHSPEEVVHLLNDYFTLLEGHIEELGGSIDKYIGDAVMAVFRDRPGREAHARRACRAALAMRAAVDAFNAQRRSQGLFSISTGIGIAGGQVISGRIGSRHGRLDFTVIRNTVNLAARLESESHRANQTGILIDSGCIGLTRGAARVAFVDRVA